MRDKKEERTKQARSNKHVHVYTLMCIVLSHAGSNLLKVMLNLPRHGQNASRQFAAHAAVTDVTRRSEHSFMHSTSHFHFIFTLHLHLYISHSTSHFAFFLLFFALHLHICFLLLFVVFLNISICTSHTPLHICTFSHSTFFALYLHFFLKSFFGISNFDNTNVIS